MEGNTPPPYILKRSNGVSWYHYLHIIGGSGNWGGKREEHLRGGEYNFCLFYAAPDEMIGKDCCAMQWCKQKKIPFGIGETIEVAYNNYQSKLLKDGK